MNLEELIEKYVRLDAEVTKLVAASNAALLRHHHITQGKLENEILDRYHSLNELNRKIEELEPK